MVNGEAELGPKGEYIVRLAADLEDLRNNEDEQVLMPDDFTDHIDTTDRLPLSAILDDEDIISRAETTVVTAPSEATPSNAEHIKQEDVKSEIHPSAGRGESQSGPRLSPITEMSTGSTHDDGVSPERCTTNSSTGAPIARLTSAKLRKMIYEAQNLVKEHENLKAQAHEPARKEHVVWEVYAGRGRLSEEVNKLEGCSARKFGIEQGWDFSRPKDRKSFIKLLIDEEPDDVHLSPECRLWSPLQELAASRSEEARQFLIDSRTVNHDTHLVFVATVYKRSNNELDAMRPSNIHGRQGHGRQRHLCLWFGFQPTSISASLVLNFQMMMELCFQSRSQHAC